MEKLHTTYICPHCGEEMPTGIMNICSHKCEVSAPNESIENHRYQIEIDRKNKEEELLFQPIWDKMDETERISLATLEMMGCKHGNVILMGSYAMDAYLDFKEQMRLKYS